MTVISLSTEACLTILHVRNLQHHITVINTEATGFRHENYVIRLN